MSFQNFLQWGLAASFPGADLRRLDEFTAEYKQLFSTLAKKRGQVIIAGSQIPEVSRILAAKGADIIFCPSFTFTEAGFWRVRHCAQARAIENQVYVVHCPAVGEPRHPLPNGYGSASILSPCDQDWPSNGVVVEVETNQHMVITGIVNIEELYENRKNGAATTVKDRT